MYENKIDLTITSDNKTCWLIVKVVLTLLPTSLLLEMESVADDDDEEEEEEEEEMGPFIE